MAPHEIRSTHRDLQLAQAASWLHQFERMDTTSIASTRKRGGGWPKKGRAVVKQNWGTTPGRYPLP